MCFDVELAPGASHPVWARIKSISERFLSFAFTTEVKVSNRVRTVADFFPAAGRGGIVQPVRFADRREFQRTVFKTAQIRYKLPKALLHRIQSLVEIAAIFEKMKMSGSGKKEAVPP